MTSLNIKPTHKPIEDYYEVHSINLIGSALHTKPLSDQRSSPYSNTTDKS